MEPTSERHPAGEPRGSNRVEQHRELLVRAGRLLSSSLEVHDILRGLSDLTVPDFADWYVVQLLDEEQTHLVPAHIAHVDPERVAKAWQVVERWPSRVDQAFGGMAAICEQRSTLVERVTPEVLREVAHDAEHLAVLRAQRFQSGVVVPLASPERCLGTITFAFAESGRHYRPDDVAVAEALAQRAAVAIEHARLYGEARRARAHAERAVRRLGILARASEVLTPSLQPDRVLEVLARFVVSCLSDYCVAYRLEPDESIVRVGTAHADPAQQHLVEQLVEVGPPQLTDPYGAGAVMRTGTAVLVSDIQPDMLVEGSQNPRHFEVLRCLRPRSSMLVPLKSHERIFGALALVTSADSGRQYTSDDLALAQELAQRAALQYENARLYHQALQAVRARDETLAIVSHDLRSPLNAIMNAAEVLARGVSEERRQRTCATIECAARRMNRLIEDLLDVTRIDEGRLVLERSEVDVGSLLNEVVELYGRIAESRGVQLVLLPNAPLSLQGDRARLQQVLSNLLDNALKFTPEGGTVTLSAGSEGNDVRFVVSDTGTGISEQRLPHLFDRFWSSGGRRHGGIGLGLAIAKGIAEAHGGRVEVVSQPGRGSSFMLVVPMAVKPRKQVEHEADQHTVLVVERDAGLRQRLNQLLLAQGYRVLLTEPGEARRRWSQERGEVDLVLLDPETQADVEQWLELRNHEPIQIPLVVIGAVPTQRAAYQFVAKPFANEQLLERVREALS